MQFTFDQGLILLLLGVVLGKQFESKRIQRIKQKAKEILGDERADEIQNPSDSETEAR